MPVTSRLLLIAAFAIASTRVNSQCVSVVSTFPYTESFETAATWTTGGINNDWAWGTPSKPVINSAGQGTKCWITGGLTTSFYSYGQRSWVESPCFDFSSLNRPVVSFMIFWETERRYDGGNLQYSINGGTTWQNAGAFGDPVKCIDQNWFNNSSIINLSGLVNNPDGWSGSVQPSSGSCSGGNGSNMWKLASHCLKNLANQPQVKFRFTFGSGTTCNDYDGLAFDNFTIYEAPILPADFAFSCINGSTMMFSDIDPLCHDTWNWNFGDTQSPFNTFNGNNATHQFSGGGTFTVTLNTGGSCAGDTQITRQVKILSVTSATQPVSCVGDSDGTAEVFVQNAAGIIMYEWSHDSTLNSSRAINLREDDYVVTINEPGSCEFQVTINVGVGPDAYPEVSLGNDTIICPGSEIILLPGSYSAFHWQDNTSDSFYVATRAGNYAVTITNSAGCTTADTVLIREDCINDIIIPNSFTPNGDNMNEVFKVYGSVTTEFIIHIYNRWGEKIFSSNDRQIAWDGSYKGKQVQEGFYNYIVNYSIDGNERFRKGSIFIAR